jgi:2-polyprenyl-3-methyl-5-hydroxy-6-metoxy-1,4-benzoquinol methylase
MDASSSSSQVAQTQERPSDKGFACPVCGSPDASDYLRLNPYELRRCQRCELIVTVPQLSSSELDAFYNCGYYSDKDGRRFTVAAGQSSFRFFRFLRALRVRGMLGSVRGKHILDVGCGNGYMLAWLKRWGAEVHGTQLSKSAVRFARKRLGLSSVFLGDISKAGYPDDYFDFISLYHVLEHVEDPLEQLRECRRVLKTRGWLSVEVPNAGGLSARRLKEYWLAWDVPRHRVHFTLKTLKALAQRSRLSTVRSTHFSIEQSPAVLLQSVINALFKSPDSVLFRSLTNDALDQTNRSDSSSLPILLVHGGVAMLLALPAVLFSGVFSLFGSGETMGLTLTKGDALSP